MPNTQSGIMEIGGYPKHYEIAELLELGRCLLEPVCPIGNFTVDAWRYKLIHKEVPAEIARELEKERASSPEDAATNNKQQEPLKSKLGDNQPVTANLKRIRADGAHTWTWSANKVSKEAIVNASLESSPVVRFNMKTAEPKRENKPAEGCNPVSNCLQEKALTNNANDNVADSSYTTTAEVAGADNENIDTVKISIGKDGSESKIFHGRTTGSGDFKENKSTEFDAEGSGKCKTSECGELANSQNAASGNGSIASATTDVAIIKNTSVCDPIEDNPVILPAPPKPLMGTRSSAEDQKAFIDFMMAMSSASTGKWGGAKQGKKEGKRDRAASPAGDSDGYEANQPTIEPAETIAKGDENAIGW
ncbi:hypothetical protein RUND412_007612 [Rhizina undulata]